MSLYRCRILSLMVLSVAVATQENATCRFGRQYLSPEEFKPIACCSCYHYMFRVPGGQNVGTAECNPQTWRIESTDEKSPQSVEPLPSNEEEICKMVGSKSKCQEWVNCCQSAIDCCDWMVGEQSNATQTSDKMSSEVHCPATWDTFKCWERAAPNSAPNQACPQFITGRVQSCVNRDVHYVERECLTDGSWNATISESLDESSYVRCVQPLDCLKGWENAKHYIEITCEILSLAMVIPAIIIFVTYRTLFKQMRIRIHINLFIALALFDSIHLVYQLTVRHPELVSVISNNNSVACRVLNALTKFSTLSMFIWMFLEGFYLHWLMINTFQQPRFSLMFITGWSTPIVITAVYAVVMCTSNIHNVSCWLTGGNIAWIVNIPLIICLMVNIIFLVNILRVVLPKIAHKNEPVYYRKACKATAMLMVPFGLLLVFILVSPNSETDYEAKLKVDCIAAGFLHTQGLIISLVLCYTNSEVQGHLRKTLGYCVKGDSQQDTSMMTGFSHLSAARPSLTTGGDTATANPETQQLMKQASHEGNNNRRDSDLIQSKG